MDDQKTGEATTARGGDATDSTAATMDVVEIELDDVACSARVSAALRGRGGALCATSHWGGSAEASVTHAAVSIADGDGGSAAPSRSSQPELLLQHDGGRTIGSVSRAASGTAYRAVSGATQHVTRADLTALHIGPLIPAASWAMLAERGWLCSSSGQQLIASG